MNDEDGSSELNSQFEAPALVTILGPTATGKTALGVELAKRFDGEIISADSRQVYRGMDIGTGKDLEEYGQIPHHLIDIADAGTEYNLFEFINDFNNSLESITTNNRLAIMVGGTGMYLDAILNRYALTRQEYQAGLKDLTDQELTDRLLALRPKQHNTTDLTDRRRLINALAIALSEENNAPIVSARAFKPITFGLQFPRETTRKRITARLKARLNSGMIEEVEQLHNQGLSWDQLDFYGLEYRYIAQHLDGKLNFNDMYQKLNSAIHQFAKQQEKWFRNIEKKGHEITWLDMNKNIVDQASDKLEKFLSD